MGVCPRWLPLAPLPGRPSGRWGGSALGDLAEQERCGAQPQREDHAGSGQVPRAEADPTLAVCRAQLTRDQERRKREADGGDVGQPDVQPDVPDPHAAGFQHHPDDRGQHEAGDVQGDRAGRGVHAQISDERAEAREEYGRRRIVEVVDVLAPGGDERCRGNQRVHREQRGSGWRHREAPAAQRRFDNAEEFFRRRKAPEGRRKIASRGVAATRTPARGGRPARDARRA